jgi:hypothetical protein
MMSTDRRPSVAGLFYDADPATLRHWVESYVAAGNGGRSGSVKALVAPHAGYQYSGPIAGSAYAALAAVAQQIERVILFGPAHRYPFRGLAYPLAERLLTPLGAVEVDRDALNSVAHLPQVHSLDRAFDGEHCLEVQLPFLQVVLGEFRVAPFLVGGADPTEVAQVMDLLWGGDETLILVSSDLSHYLDYETARSTDRITTHAIESLAPESMDHHGACGCTPIQGLLLEARRRGLAAETLDLRSSGDTAGPHDRVVGYGAYAFH